MLRTVIWHFSDLHHSSDKFQKTIEKRKSTRHIGAGASDHLTQWQNSIKNARGFFKKAGFLPDWIVCSGDLASNDQKTEIPASVSFLREIAKIARISNRRVVVAPGNHDVAWDGDPLAVFNAATKRARFSTPFNPPLIEEALDGLLPIPIDTTHLIGTSRLEEFDWKLIADEIGSTGAGDKIRAAVANQLKTDQWYRAGIVRPSDLTELLRMAGELSGQHRLRAFPILVWHHPVFAPAAEKADFDPEDSTVLAPLVKRRLLEADIQLVLQGHRHERTAHKEGILGHPELPAGLVAVTGASLNENDSFSVLEIVRSDDGVVRSVSGFTIDRAQIGNPRGLQLWFRKTLISRSVDVTRSVRKVLLLHRTGISRVDYYFHHLQALAARSGFKLHLQAFHGLITKEVDARVISHLQNSPPLSVDQDPPGSNHKDITLSLRCKEAKEPLSAVCRIEAQGAHAFFEEEAALLRGTSHPRWNYEVTEFCCPVPTRLLEVIVRFPYAIAVPSTASVRVFESTHKGSPATFWDDNITGLRCIEEKSVSVWGEGRRLIVQIPQPLPGLTYCVSWKLPKLMETQTMPKDGALLKLFPSLVCPPGKRLHVEWDTLEETPLPGTRTLLHWRHLQAGILGIGSYLTSNFAAIRDLVAQGRFEAALMVPDAAFGQRPKERAKIRVAGAIGPCGSRSWNRWKVKPAWGTGLAGVSIRNAQLAVGGTSPSVKASSVPTFGIVGVDDSGPPQTYQVCIPGIAKDTTAPCCAVALSVLGEGEPPHELTDRKALSELATEMWVETNRYWNGVGLPLELGLDAPLLGRVEYT